MAQMERGNLFAGVPLRLEQEQFDVLTQAGGVRIERIVSRGKIIYPRRMEEAMLRHPAVRYACVIARADPQAGQLPKAIVELHAGTSAGEEELLAHARALLGEDAPALVEIIAKMPMTPTGKLARAELQARESSLI